MAAPKTHNTNPMRQGLPPALRLLYLGSSREPALWLEHALAADTAVETSLAVTLDLGQGAARLRTEPFDCVLLAHESDHFDAPAAVEALRQGGVDSPLIVVHVEQEPELTAWALESGADGCLNLYDVTARGLLWTAARSIERRRLLRDHRRQASLDRQRGDKDLDDFTRRFEAQQRLLDAFDSLDPADASSPSACDFMAWYADLLGSYLQMTDDGLGADMQRVVDYVAEIGDVRPAQLFSFHLQTLRRAAAGLTGAGLRQASARGDLLGHELLLHLAERLWPPADAHALSPRAPGEYGEAADPAVDPPPGDSSIVDHAPPTADSDSDDDPSASGPTTIEFPRRHVA